MTWKVGVGKSFIGNHAVSIKNSSGWAEYGSMQNQNIKTSTTYTASAMVNADGITEGGGILKITLYDGKSTIDWFWNL